MAEFEHRDSGGAVAPAAPKPAPPLTEKAQLEQRLRDRGELTTEMQAELDRTFPEPRQPFGSVGQFARGERRTGDVLDIKDHQDWLNRKDEILKAAYGDNN